MNYIRELLYKCVKKKLSCFTVGYIDDCFIVNDPYGDVNTGYTEHNGAFVSYKTNRWWFTKKWAGILEQ